MRNGAEWLIGGNERHKVAVNRVPDALKLSFTLPEAGYAEAAAAAAAKLAGEGGFKLDAVRNGWTTVRCRNGALGTLGLRLLLSCESDKDDGCDFTDEAHVPFMAVLHTPASAAAEEGLVACWQSRRTARGRKGFHAKLKALRDAVPVPPCAAELSPRQGA